MGVALEGMPQRSQRTPRIEVARCAATLESSLTLVCIAHVVSDEHITLGVVTDAFAATE
jgi:hypothetical protein